MMEKWVNLSFTSSGSTRNLFSTFFPATKLAQTRSIQRRKSRVTLAAEFELVYALE